MKTTDSDKLKKQALISHELSADYKPQVLNTTISKISVDLKRLMVKKNLLVCIYEID